jgi:hypothetical protein
MLSTWIYARMSLPTTLDLVTKDSNSSATLLIFLTENAGIEDFFFFCVRSDLL